MKPNTITPDTENNITAITFTFPVKVNPEANVVWEGMLALVLAFIPAFDMVCTELMLVRLARVLVKISLVDEGLVGFVFVSSIFVALLIFVVFSAMLMDAETFVKGLHMGWNPLHTPVQTYPLANGIAKHSRFVRLLFEVWISSVCFFLNSWRATALSKYIIAFSGLSLFGALRAFAEVLVVDCRRYLIMMYSSRFRISFVCLTYIILRIPPNCFGNACLLINSPKTKKLTQKNNIEHIISA